jgi:hypothetical protein
MAGEPELREGESGEWVTHLQGYLQHYGYQLELTGHFDGPTSDALAQFQQYVGLTPTGVADAPTWAALEGTTVGEVAQATTEQVAEAVQTHAYVELVGEIDVREGLILYMVANNGGQVASNVHYGMQVMRENPSGGEEQVFDSAEVGDDLHPGSTADRFVYTPTFEDGTYNVWLDINSGSNELKTNRYFDVHDGQVHVR